MLFKKLNDAHLASLSSFRNSRWRSR